MHHTIELLDKSCAVDHQQISTKIVVQFHYRFLPTTMSCRKCLQHIHGNDLCAECDGSCARRFHAKCVGLGEDTLKILSQNVIWVCDDCLVQFRKFAVREEHGDKASQNATIIEEELADLKSKVNGILNTLSSLTSKQNTATLYHSTPVTSFELFNGTNNESSSSSSPQNKGKYAYEEISDTFSLLLTNVDNRVSEQEICNLVSRCLDAPIADCNRVTKLVPKYRECRDFDFVSFKVTLNERWKSAAMNPSTWPCGLRYREFVQRSNVWRPDL